MVIVRYINKAWLKIYCNQMRNFKKKPSLLLIAKNSEELKDIWDLWREVKREVYGEEIEEYNIGLPCLGITENQLIWSFKKGYLIVGFTDFLISHDINNPLLIDYLCKSMEGK